MIKIWDSQLIWWVELELSISKDYEWVHFDENKLYRHYVGNRNYVMLVNTMTSLITDWFHCDETLIPPAGNTKANDPLTRVYVEDFIIAPTVPTHEQDRETTESFGAHTFPMFYNSVLSRPVKKENYTFFPDVTIKCPPSKIIFPSKMRLLPRIRPWPMSLMGLIVKFSLPSKAAQNKCSLHLSIAWESIPV